MTTNKEYELASEAILQYKAGKYKTLESARRSVTAKSTVVKEMLEQQAVYVEPIADLAKLEICNACENNSNGVCMINAFVIEYLILDNNDMCPENKW